MPVQLYACQEPNCAYSTPKRADLGRHHRARHLGKQLAEEDLPSLKSILIGSSDGTASSTGGLKRQAVIANGYPCDKCSDKFDRARDLTYVFFHAYLNVRWPEG